mmetsp:Transcript_46008/g.144141  ORF Transcript_46008/g.144141 Transcript_46008/m.144141 type:complete len:571 (+) Transcript_46008:96-1808(+)
MIIYESAKFHPWRVFQTTGSVMPFSVAVALPCSLITVGLKLLPRYAGQDIDSVWEVMGIHGSVESVASAAFSGMSFLIGFLVVFRSSQAYNRFWEGLSSINAMQGEWWDAASSLAAFCKCSTAPVEEVILFQHTLVRLISMLNGVVLMELSAGFHREENHDTTKRAFELELIDAEGIDSESLYSLNSSGEKVELIFQWIQQLVVESDAKGIFSVPGPILSRSFQELANGMVQYRQASKIARTPLPFPYMQATELLLISHWLCTPMLMCAWVDSAMWAGILCFIQVMFYWSLNSIATELENPFGEDANDLPAKEIQQDFNKRLLLLIRPGTQRTAKLSKTAAFEETKDIKGGKMKFGKSVTLGTDGINAALDGKVFCSTKTMLEENRITWGILQSAIAEKMQVGYDSESESGDGQSTLGEARSRSHSKGLRRTRSPVNRSPRKLGGMDRERSKSRSKEAPHFFAKEYKHLVGASDPEKLSSQLACLSSLPELLTVCMDVRDQLKAVAATEEVIAPDAGMPARYESTEATDGDVAVEALLQPAPVHRVSGKPLSDGGCLGIGGCNTKVHSRV